MATARAGFEHAAVVEWNREACETMTRNREAGYPLMADWRIHRMDVREFDYASLESEVDLVAGGPPCQPFSAGGKRAGADDLRDMFPAAAEAVRSLRPKAFIFENVRGLTTRSFTEYFEYVVNRLSLPEDTIKNETWQEHNARLRERLRYEGDGELRYDVTTKVLNAADYGVPQHRHRVFLVGFRSDLCIPWEFPKPTHGENALLYAQYVTGTYWEEHGIMHSDRVPAPDRKRGRIEAMRRSLFPPPLQRWRTVRDAISDLPDPEKGNGGIQGHDHNPGARSYPGHTGSPLDEPAKALKAGDHGVPGGENMLRRPDGSVRYFTVRECARIQTFPDDYHFFGPWTECMRGLGNAVPVELGEVVARSVARALRSSGQIGSNALFKQIDVGHSTG